MSNPNIHLPIYALYGHHISGRKASLSEQSRLDRARIEPHHREPTASSSVSMLALAAGSCPAALMASELMARGRHSAAALEALLQGASSTTLAPTQHDGIRELAEQILRCLDRALAALQGGEGAFDDATGGGCPSKKRRSPPVAAAQARPPKRRARAISAEMPTRVEKRTTPDDGFMWRKYGQKDILNSKYPRTYFRCAYMYDKGCKARRQVQRSEDDDPSVVYVVTYFGDHTCGLDAAATAAVCGDEKSPQSLVISFGSGTPASSSSPWLSSSSSDNDDLGTNSSRWPPALCLPEEEEEGGDLKANDACNVESALAPLAAAEPVSSSSAYYYVPCPSPDLHSLLHYFEGDSLFDMEFISSDFDESKLLQ